MDFRRSFSKPFKRLKGKLPGGSRKRDGRSGGEDGRKGREADVDESEANQRNSYLHSEVEVDDTVESGPSREVNEKKTAFVDVNPPMATPSIPHIGEPESM